MKNPHRSVRCPARSARAWLAPLLGCAVVVASGLAQGAGTSPVLALTTAAVAPSSGGGRLVTATGAFHFDDLVQSPFPAAGLMVVSGNRFVRYEVDGQVIEATAASVQNGVTPDELSALLQMSGAPIGPARLVQVQAGNVSVVLPTDLAAGPALVMLYAHHEDEHFVSNAIPVVLP